MKLLVKWLVSITLIGLIGFSHAANLSVEFFSSNNNKIINTQQAYARLVGKSQEQLNDTIIRVLQDNHMEQGRFKTILGTYQMSSDKQVTADNTEIFYASPQQALTNERVFSVAQQLATTLQQESVAVFIPAMDAQIGHIIIRFKSKQPGILEAIRLIRTKLPAHYSTAFSMNLTKTQGIFAKAEVSSIEWLGASIQPGIIKKAFPHESTMSQKGRAYLVYKDGQVDSL